jgi:hypothetical protein
MKFRHSQFYPGTLVGAHSGAVVTVTITGITHTPDILGTPVAPLWYKGFPTGGHPRWESATLYPHGGLILVPASGLRDYFPYTSWTCTDPVAGTYVFSGPEVTLAGTYTGGEVAGPLCNSILRNYAGDKLYETLRYNNAANEPRIKYRIKNYADGNFSFAGCGSTPSSSLPPWPGTFPIMGLWPSGKWASWLGVMPVTNTYSISGKILLSITIQKRDPEWEATAGATNAMLIVLRVGSLFSARLYDGYLAGTNSPEGVYTKYSGCIAYSGTLEIEPYV